MQLVALVGAQSPWTERLTALHEHDARLHLHPLPAQALDRLHEAWTTLGYAGALVLAGNGQAEALRLAQHASVEARALGAVDTLQRAPHGSVGDHHGGKALGALLRSRMWDARGARVVVLGDGLDARSSVRELATLGVEHLTLLANSASEAERDLRALSTRVDAAAFAYGDVAAAPLLERADLLVRVDAHVEPPTELLGPHLAVVDWAMEPLSPWRRAAQDVGALALGRLDLDAHRVRAALHTLTGVEVGIDVLMAVMHEA